MVWFTQPKEIADAQGKPTGRWRMTATSDEGGGGPHGDTTHDHATAEEAEACERCDEFVSRQTGFPSYRKRAHAKAMRDGAERALADAKRELLAAWKRGRDEVSEPDLDDEQLVHVAVSLGTLRRLERFTALRPALEGEKT